MYQKKGIMLLLPFLGPFKMIAKYQKKGIMALLLFLGPFKYSIRSKSKQQSDDETSSLVYSHMPPSHSESNVTLYIMYLKLSVSYQLHVDIYASSLVRPRVIGREEESRKPRIQPLPHSDTPKTPAGYQRMWFSMCVNYLKNTNIDYQKSRGLLGPDLQAARPDPPV